MYLAYFMTPHPVETLHWKPEMSILMVMLEEKSGLGYMHFCTKCSSNPG